MFVRTERLFLRPPWLEDAPELARAISDERIVRMLAHAPWPYHEGHARNWIAAQADPYAPDLLVTLPEERGRIIGSCGLRHQDGELEVGYWIEPGSWGRGYATEAVRGMIPLARLLGHRRIVGRPAADNPASERVLRKAGFRPTGRARPFHSLGRSARIEAPEYALDLCETDCPDDAPMRQAA